MAETPPATVKSAMRTLDIIEYVVSRRRPLIAQEIAAALAIPVSSLSYLLGTLVERRYLARDGRRYTAGPGLDRLRAPGEAFSLAEMVQPLVRTLRVQLDETTSFFVQAGWDVESLVTEAGEQALRYAIGAGRRVPLHAFSAGKALLAAMPADELARYFAETDRQTFTATTITDERALRDEIALIRARGFSRTHEEYTPGIQGIGCAAFINGSVVGAFSIAIPTARFDDALERRAADLLRRTTDLLASS